LQYYLVLNNYYIYNNSIYVKIKGTKISYSHVGTLLDILYNNFSKNIISFYNENFELYFKGFDFDYLLSTFFIKSKYIIESIRDISTQRIEPNFGLIEFSDGVYSIKYDRFFPNSKYYNFNNETATLKYYNSKYNYVRKTKPIN